MQDFQFERKTYMDTYNCDISMRATAAGILRQFNETATCNMSFWGPGYYELLSSGKALMVNRMDIEIIDPPLMEQPIVCRTWPSAPKGPIIGRCYEIERDGKTLAKGCSQWSLVDIAERRILRMSEQTFPNYRYGEFREVFPGKFRIDRQEAAAAETVGTHRVRLMDCDCNGHLNNTYYADILSDFIPELYDHENHWISKVRMHFSKEAPLGTELSIKRFRKGSAYYFQTFLESGELNFECSMEVAGPSAS